MHFHALWVPWHCSRTHAKIWSWSVGVFFGGGSFGGGGGGGGLAPGWGGGGSGRLVGVAVRLVCCHWCSFTCTNKMFFQSLFLLCFSSVCCRLLPGEFFPLLCSLAWLAVAFFRSGLLCTAELRFSDRFFGPCSHVVGMCSCKARRFVEALRSSWIFNFALFLFASAFFSVWFAVHRTASVFTA